MTMYSTAARAQADEQAGEAAEEAPRHGEAALGHEAAAGAARAQVPPRNTKGCVFRPCNIFFVLMV